MRDSGVHGEGTTQMKSRDTAEAATDANRLDHAGRCAGEGVVVPARPQQVAAPHRTRQSRSCCTESEQRAPIRHRQVQLLEDFVPRHGGMVADAVGTVGGAAQIGA